MPTGVDVWSDHKREAFLECLRLGMQRRAAALAVGFVPNSVTQWIQIGLGTHSERTDREDGRYTEFALDVEKAEARCVRTALKKIVQASEDHNHWTAAAWLLERLHPETYGKKQTMKVEGQVQHVTTYAFEEPRIPEAETAPPEENKEQSNGSDTRRAALLPPDSSD